MEQVLPLRNLVALLCAGADMTEQSPSKSYERELGGVQARLEALEEGQATIQRDVREIRDVVVSVKGGWKTLSVIAALSAVVGGLIVKFLAWAMLLPR